MEDEAPARVRGQRRAALGAAGALQEGARHHSGDMCICTDSNSVSVSIEGSSLVLEKPEAHAVAGRAPAARHGAGSCEQITYRALQSRPTFDHFAALPASAPELPEGDVPVGVAHRQDVAQRAEGERAHGSVVSGPGLTQLHHLRAKQAPATEPSESPASRLIPVLGSIGHVQGMAKHP